VVTRSGWRYRFSQTGFMSTSILPNQKVQPNERGPSGRIGESGLLSWHCSSPWESRSLWLEAAAQRGYFGPAPVSSQGSFDFNLINQDAQPFQLHQPAREGGLVFFSVFTHCPNVCPTVIDQSGCGYQKLGPDLRKQVQIMFWSVDAQRDTPTALKTYVPWLIPALLV